LTVYEVSVILSCGEVTAYADIYTHGYPSDEADKGNS
jgi:hypothetical protein